MSFNFNPNATTQPANSFLQQTQGAFQGFFEDDPSAKNWLCQGAISTDVESNLYGGIAVTENTTIDSGNLPGNTIAPATAYANLTAFTVFTQGPNGIMTPGGSVPQYAPGMSIPYFRLGSNARIWVQCDPTLANELSGNAINQQVSWDFTNNKLVAFNTTALNAKVLKVYTQSQIVQNTDGALAWVAGPCALIQI